MLSGVSSALSTVTVGYDGVAQLVDWNVYLHVFGFWILHELCVDTHIIPFLA